MDAKKRQGVWDDSAWQEHLDAQNKAADKEAEEARKKEDEEAAAQPEETPAAESGEPEKKEGDEGAETPAETPETKAEEAPAEGAETPAAETPAPTQTLEVKFRGAPRSFDLTKEDEKRQVSELLSKGLNYDALVAERDQHVARDATTMRDNYFRESGILALDPADNQWKPDAAGVVRWASAVLGPERFREAASTVLGAGASPQGTAGGMDLKEIEALETEAAKYPDDPVYEPIRKMAAALKVQARQVASLQTGIDSRIKQFEGRFAGMDEAQKRTAQAEYQQAMFQHRDAEIAKVPGLAVDEFDKDYIVAYAAKLERAAIQQGRQFTPDLSRECITAAIKAFAAKRGATATQQAKAVQQQKIEARPKPKTPAPSASAPKPAPPKGDETSPRQKRDAMWKEFPAAMSRT